MIDTSYPGFYNAFAGSGDLRGEPSGDHHRRPGRSGQEHHRARRRRQLGCLYLDSGAMYRAFALKVERLGLAASARTTPPRIEALARETEIGFTGPARRPDGRARRRAARRRDPHAARSPSWPRAWRRMPAVRARMTELQRAHRGARAAGRRGPRHGDGAVPGRGGEDLPRRVASRSARAAATASCARAGSTLDLDEVREEIERRDRRDRERDVAPLVPAPDAIVIDTTGMSVERAGRGGAARRCGAKVGPRLTGGPERAWGPGIAASARSRERAPRASCSSREVDGPRARPAHGRRHRRREPRLVLGSAGARRVAAARAALPDASRRSSTCRCSARSSARSNAIPIRRGVADLSGLDARDRRARARRRAARVPRGRPHEGRPVASGAPGPGPHRGPRPGAHRARLRVGHESHPSLRGARARRCASRSASPSRRPSGLRRASTSTRTGRDLHQAIGDRVMQEIALLRRRAGGDDAERGRPRHRNVAAATPRPGGITSWSKIATTSPPAPWTTTSRGRSEPSPRRSRLRRRRRRRRRRHDRAEERSAHVRALRTVAAVARRGRDRARHGARASTTRKSSSTSASRARASSRSRSSPTRDAIKVGDDDRRLPREDGEPGRPRRPLQAARRLRARVGPRQGRARRRPGRRGQAGAQDQGRRGGRPLRRRGVPARLADRAAPGAERRRPARPDRVRSRSSSSTSAAGTSWCRAASCSRKSATA